MARRPLRLARRLRDVERKARWDDFEIDTDKLIADLRAQPLEDRRVFVDSLWAGVKSLGALAARLEREAFEDEGSADKPAAPNTRPRPL